jgi:hypothetical protein
LSERSLRVSSRSLLLNLFLHLGRPRESRKSACRVEEVEEGVSVGGVAEELAGGGEFAESKVLKE